MKTLLLSLLIIIVGILLFTAIAFGLFYFDTNSAPTVSTSTATTTELITPLPTVSTTTTPLDAWQWTQATTSAQGLTFSYPNPLPTTYVSVVDWPPVVSLTLGSLSCLDGAMASHSGEVTTAKRQTINGAVYCVSISSEGAAGSTYTSYQYATMEGDSVASTTFTLSTPQCLNYDEPNQTACKTEQAEFDVTAMAVRILDSIKKI